jgi:nucleoid-associated protein YgaU
MTDPAVKIASAFCVLLAGLCASTLFRQRTPVPAPTPSAPAPAAVAIKSDLPPKSSVSPAAKEVKRLEGVFQPIRPAPELEHLNSKLSDSMESMRSDERTASTGLPFGCRIHKVVDGDTLELLAEHYLGFSARATEIFETNRGVLSDPEILPIGVELKIPLRHDSVTPTALSQPVQP